MNKKIVFFLYDLSLGGTERVVVILSNYLVNKDYEVEILTVGTKNFFEKEIDSRIKTKCFNLLRIFHSFRSLRGFIKQNDFDFFVSNGWPITILSVIAFLFSPNLLNKQYPFFIDLYKTTQGSVEDNYMLNKYNLSTSLFTKKINNLNNCEFTLALFDYTLHFNDNNPSENFKGIIPSISFNKNTSNNNLNLNVKYHYYNKSDYDDYLNINLN